MATIASKPRGAQAAASEAASVSRATAARKMSTGNASGERAAKAAQINRRASQESTTTEARTKASGTKASGTKASGSRKKASGSASKASGSKASGSKASGSKASGSKASGNGKSAKGASSRSKGGTGRKAASSNGSSGRGKAAAAESSKRTAAANGKGRSSSPKSRAESQNGRNGDSHDSDNGGSGDSPGKHLASALFKSTEHRSKHPVAKAVAKKTLKTIGRRSLGAGAETLRTVADSAGAASRQALRAGVSRVVESRPPVQASVDVAAPLRVVWEEWMTFDAFTEGLHKIEDVERHGDELTGRVASPHEREWRAEIVDEREQQAFAWRSVEGTDCAGLITFHRLSERLTRIEADLDVLPTNPAEAFLLSLRIPTRRAERELQLFKASVEFINPDAYESDDSEGGQPEQPNDGDRPDADNDE